jgi:hypothetical protein
MHKYGDSGDVILSLFEDIVAEGEAMWDHWDRSATKKDMFEILIKGAAFDLCELGTITEISRDILLYSMGIDEYYPRLSAKEMGKKFGMANTDVRSVRFHTARKVLRHILDD